MEAATQIGSAGLDDRHHPFRWSAMLGGERLRWYGGRRRSSSVLLWSLAVALSEGLLCLVSWVWLRELPQHGVLLLVIGSIVIQLAGAVVWLSPVTTTLFRTGHRGPEQQPIKAAFGLVGLFLSAVAMFYALAVLFGAPFTEQIPQTLLFSVHLATLTTLPLMATRDTTPKALQHIFLGLTNRAALQSSWLGEHRMRLLTRASQWAVIGAWAGSVALPLDWERPWQEWPAPCVLGASVGHVVALLVPLRLPGVADYIP